MTLDPRVKLFFDILPLAVFFIAFKYSGLNAATQALIAITVIIVIITYGIERRIALVPLITALIVGIFGGLTLWLGDETFIKLKPTIVNLVFATILLVGYARGKAMMKPVLGSAFALTEQGWLVLSRRWGIFFLCMAGLNELVWRSMPTSVWVDFKVFGLIGMTMIFAVAQARFIERNSIDK